VTDAAARCLATLAAAAEAHHRAAPVLVDGMVRTVEQIRRALASGGQVLVCGNGGSAAESQHFAAELSGRYRRERRALAALALTVDTSALTAIGNDYGFAQVFARQVEAYGRGGDVLVVLSTSGRSANVIAAAEAGRARGLHVVALTGHDAGPLADVAHEVLAVPDRDTARVQEVHLTVLHALCDEVERMVVES